MNVVGSMSTRPFLGIRLRKETDEYHFVNSGVIYPRNHATWYSSPGQGSPSRVQAHKGMGVGSQAVSCVSERHFMCEIKLS